MSESESAAFLRAICDRPDDDLPRLIYADWLEEHGQVERAEFIRVQVELADWEYQREKSGKSGWRTLKIRNRVDALRRREMELWEMKVPDGSWLLHPSFNYNMPAYLPSQ